MDTKDIDIMVIDATEDTPEIIMDSTKPELKITGASYPENALKLYSPVTEWVNNLDAETISKLSCVLYFKYINSASKKMLHEIFVYINNFYSPGSKMNIIWNFDKYDEDMEELGLELIELLNIPYKFIEKNVTDDELEN